MEELQNELNNAQTIDEIEAVIIKSSNMGFTDIEEDARIELKEAQEEDEYGSYRNQVRDTYYGGVL